MCYNVVKLEGGGEIMGDGTMGLSLVFSSALAHQAEVMTVKRYGDKHGQGGMFFNAILCLFAVVFFLFSDKGGLVFPSGVVAFGLANSGLYAIGFYTGYLSYIYGSFGLTRLVTSFVCIIPIFYGIVFERETQGVIFYVAVALILASLFLMRFQKNSGEGKTQFSLKWIISVIFVIISNGFITVLGKMQHSAFGDTYKNEYLIVTFIGSAFWLFLMGFILERKSFKSTIKFGVVYGAVAGLFNALNNWLTLTTYNYMAISISAPLKTGISLVLSFLVSLIVYKERFSARQILAVVLGTVAVVMINLPQ